MNPVTFSVGCACVGALLGAGFNRAAVELVVADNQGIKSKSYQRLAIGVALLALSIFGTAYIASSLVSFAVTHCAVIASEALAYDLGALFGLFLAYLTLREYANATLAAKALPAAVVAL